MKKKHNYFLKLLSLLFLIFIFFYAMSKSGYYKSHITKDTILTDQKIKEFENDVKNGKVIDIESYYVPKKVNYSSKASSLGKELTIKLSSSLEIFFKNSGKVLKKLFW